MRMKRIGISPEIIRMMMTDGMAYRVTKGLPDGCRVRQISPDFQTGLVWIFVEHESFEDIPEGSSIPAYAPEMERLVLK